MQSVLQIIRTYSRPKTFLLPRTVKDRRRDGAKCHRCCGWLLLSAALTAAFVSMVANPNAAKRSHTPIASHNSREERPSAASCRGAPNFCRGDDRGDGVGVGVGGLRCSTRPQDAIAIAVVSHYSYNVSWLEEQPFCYEVMERVHGAGEAQPQHPQVSINKAQEAVAYLRYIIDHYDELPRHVIFLHDHRTAWHQLDMVELLHAVRLDAYPFFSLNGIWNRGLRPTDYAQAARFWRENDLDRSVGAFPRDNNAIEFMCCAQFVVSRARIRQRPLALWQRLYEWVERTELSNAVSSRIFEWVWHVLMGEPFVSERPDPSRVCGDTGEVTVRESDSEATANDSGPHRCYSRISRLRFPQDTKGVQETWNLVFSSGLSSVTKESHISL